MLLSCKFGINNFQTGSMNYLSAHIPSFGDKPDSTIGFPIADDIAVIIQTGLPEKIQKGNYALAPCY